MSGKVVQLAGRFPLEGQLKASLRKVAAAKEGQLRLALLDTLADFIEIAERHELPEEVAASFRELCDAQRELHKNQAEQAFWAASSEGEL